MPLPHNALVLVADGRKMLFFRNHGDGNQIDLRPEAHDVRRGSQGPRHQVRRAGRDPAKRGLWAFDPEETDFQQQEEDRSIKDAAEELKVRALRNDFDALAIVAPPKALGMLKKASTRRSRGGIVCTVDKQMSGRPIPEIEAMLTGKTYAENFPPFSREK